MAQIPSPAIEAKSLSSLTALASNPPAYPRNPTHVRHEPLVLYIARVPGSKDVFLSPMKPREKVVTAEDIQSSLYFVHVEQPEDAHLVAAPDFRNPDYSEQRQNSPNRSTAPPVQRKAVPGASFATGGAATPLRKPIPGTLAPTSNYENRQNVSAGGYAQHVQRPEFLGADYGPRRSFDSLQQRQENQRPVVALRSSSDNPQPAGTSLTLIRRDPASGAQWNVARIEDPSTVEVSSSNPIDLVSKRKIGTPMYIEVFNPGYSKFLHSQTSGEPVLPGRPNDVPVRTNQMETQTQPLVQEPWTSYQTSSSENTFRRRLWMEGSQYTNGGFGHRKKNSYDSSIGRPDSTDGYGAQGERSSMDLRPPPSSSSLTRNGQPYSTIQVSDRQTSFRGYVFTSPWNGRCEFATGGVGGSLKCRHIVPGLQGAPPAAMQVSELRFNLPSSSKVATPRGEESSKRSSFFHRGRHSRNNSSVSINRDDGVEDARNSLDRLDLSLGQEFAGGGFGGKQAKLGKIIIEDEGLKMMDLLVAANLGLWWRAYEKGSTPSRGDRGSF
ncbi:hypothetical protein BKA66DRAFT_476926 [Pyrenochaeta sp. MPI-SDFR-AT-0127]|nr:hypothetical protein BKA66DRAFT_476926 [Pyrenochaeta sp. MPI-SDFR-AT-0127]